MPLFNYACPECDYQKEYLEKSEDKIAHWCVKCQKNMVKTISTTNFKFNGQGFYITDYKRKGK
jgi:putative FmdB family regulatory protein